MYIASVLTFSTLKLDYIYGHFKWSQCNILNTHTHTLSLHDSIIQAWAELCVLLLVTFVTWPKTEQHDIRHVFCNHPPPPPPSKNKCIIIYLTNQLVFVLMIMSYWSWSVPLISFAAGHMHQALFQSWSAFWFKWIRTKMLSLSELARSTNTLWDSLILPPPPPPPTKNSFQLTYMLCENVRFHMRVSVCSRSFPFPVICLYYL